MVNVIGELEKNGVLPVVILENSENATNVARALSEAGISCVEITFRTDAAEESIRNITKEYPEMLVGAGTILSIEQVKQAVEAGAKFVVSPGFNPKVVEYCLKEDIPIIPGVCTPTEIEMALRHGINVLKFFPAEAVGGIKYIKAISAPYSQVRFLPTGGINEVNLCDYLSFEKVVACGGSWMVKQELIKNSDYEEIKKITMLAVETVNSVRKK